MDICQSQIDKEGVDIIKYPIGLIGKKLSSPVFLADGPHRVYIHSSDKGGAQVDPRIYRVEIFFFHDGVRNVGTGAPDREKFLLERVDKLGGQIKNLLAMKEASSIAAHEIRNPLSTLKGFLQLLEGSFSEDDPRKEYVMIMTSEVGRIERLVVDFTSASRRHDYRVIDVIELVSHVMDIFDKHPQARRVKCHITFQGKGPTRILGDRDNMIQAFTNILQNSCEAAPDGSVVSIDVDSDGDQVEIGIRNEGEGIEASTLGRIFAPYFTTKRGGTGLGLYVTKQIVQAHGGTLEVKSKLGEGATFYMRFPKLR